MQNVSDLNEEHEIASFPISFEKNNVVYKAHVHVVDMCGWLLYECFVHPQNKIYYICSEEDSNNLEWLNMEEDSDIDITLLMEGIRGMNRHYSFLN